jgi:hypothetical protein
VDVYLDVEGDVTSATFRPASQRLAWWIVGRWLVRADVLLLMVFALEWLVGGFTTAFVVAGEIAFGGLLLLGFIVFVAPRARRNKALSEGHMHFVAREDAYQIDGPFGTQTFRWTTYTKAHADSRFIYLFLNRRVAQVIPLQFVPDAEPLRNHLRKLGLLRPNPRTFIVF